jgi:hypothetical protein
MADTKLRVRAFAFGKVRFAHIVPEASVTTMT